MFKRPSFIAFLLNGLLLGIALLIAIYYRKELMEVHPKKKLMIVLVASIAIGVHSMLHYREEKDYRFNPLA